MRLVVCVQIGTAKKRYEVGLDKLATTETSVAAMQVRSAHLSHLQAQSLSCWLAVQLL